MPGESEVGVYSIQSVETTTGVAATTLRHWETAYGLICPQRTAGGHRLYSQEDVERIKWLKHKIDVEGLRAGAAHSLLRQKLDASGAIALEAASKGAVMILVAEKDPITADLEHYFLSREGFDVHIVLDGRVAVEKAEALHPDLIILDVILPGLSGLKVCKALKSRPSTSDIPLLVFSVLDVRDRALDAGADAFLLKPIEQPKLIGAVKSLLTEKSRLGSVS